MDKFDEALDQSDDDLIAFRLGELIWCDIQKNDGCFEDLTKCEKALGLVYAFDKEMCSDGFDLFFYSKAGSYTQEILQACLEIEAYKTAEILEKALQLFPIQPIPKDLYVRRSYMQRLDKHISEEWYNLGEAYYDYEDHILKLLVQYMKRNKAFLFTDD